MIDDPANLANTAVGNRRRSQRVFLNIRVVARFRLLQRDWIVEGESVVVNAHGGTIQLSVAPMAAGDIITLTNPDTGHSESCRVIRIEALTNHRSNGALTGHATNGEKSPGTFEVSVAFDRPSPTFWSLALPPSDWLESGITHD
jgi:hypothetical protein